MFLPHCKTPCPLGNSTGQFLRLDFLVFILSLTTCACSAKSSHTKDLFSLIVSCLNPPNTFFAISLCSLWKVCWCRLLERLVCIGCIPIFFANLSSTTTTIFFAITTKVRIINRLYENLQVWVNVRGTTTYAFKNCLSYRALIFCSAIIIPIYIHFYGVIYRITKGRM